MNKTILKHQKAIAELLAKIQKIRKKCPHKNVEGKYGANTGNYDPTCDCYWVDVKCKDCGDSWTYDSVDDKEMYYRKY
jgi:hypothetical protein